MEVVKRGSSGAYVEIIDYTRTIKLDTDRTSGRVREQGLWLQAHAMPELPTVTMIRRDGYEMRTLQPIDIDFARDYTGYVKILIETWQAFRESSKRRGIDARCPRIRPSRRATVRYVVGICTQLSCPTLGLELLGVANDLKLGDQLLMTTHGDPIVDNLMKHGGQYVLIDPIPATRALPDHPAVDIGRLVQSAAGYEAIRYADVTPYGWRQAVDGVLNEVCDPRHIVRDARQALFFAVIHMLRGARTAPNLELKLALAGHAAELLEELKSWMR